MPHARRFRSQGFTLVEVLVVVGIMLILLSLLMPAFTKVHEQGNMVVCQNNLRQIGNCLQTYATQQNGYLPANMPSANSAWDQGVPCWPLGEFWNETGGMDYYEVGYLFDQCGANQNLFVCPSSNMESTYPEYGSSGTTYQSQWCWIAYNGAKGSKSYPYTYQYYGGVCGTTGSGGPPNGLVAITPNTNPPYPAPWARVITGTTIYYGAQTQFTANFGYAVTVNLQPGDVTNPPLMSDLCMNVMASWGWGNNKKSNTYFSHGTQLNGSKSNVLYSDFHVESDVINSNNWFVSDTQWTSAALPFYHYR